MKFIKPSEISSKIMTLIEESDEYVVIVSPYVKISKWYKLLKKFDNLKSRNIPIEFIIRDDSTNQLSFKELDSLGIKFKAIKDLHCKLYLNEKYAIVSSMNLLLSSEINSLELAYQTETEKEYNELKEFCERYLQIDFSRNETLSNNLNTDWRDSVCNILSEKLERNIKVWQENGTFHINTGTNNYSAFIWNSKHNQLRISGILSGKEFEFLQKNSQNLPKVEGLKIEMQHGSKGHYDTIWATGELPLKSSDLDSVNDKEKQLIAQKISEFIFEIDVFKKWAAHNLR